MEPQCSGADFDTGALIANGNDQRNKIALAVLGALLGTMALASSATLFRARQARNQATRWRRRDRRGARRRRGRARSPIAGAARQGRRRQGPERRQGLPGLPQLRQGRRRQGRPAAVAVVGRPVASVAGFAYSDAVKAIGGDWTYDKLDHWIAKPSAMAAGTKMAFPGEPEATKRADILAYLQKQSDSPVPFPQ